MAGSLDDNPPDILGRTEYQYLLLGKGITGKARMYVSKSLTMTHAEIADELRRLANWIEGR